MERDKLIRLVRAAQKGDETAMNDLFNAFYNDVYYFALKTVKDEDVACDVTQETFVEIIRTLPNLQEPAAFVKWMKEITYHQCTRYFKKKKDVLVDEDEEGATIFDSIVEEKAEFIPDEALNQEDFRKTILAMLDTLSEEQRAAVLLYYYDELPVKDVAKIQGVSEGTVKSRLNYARKSIKSSVEDYEKRNGVKLHCAGVLPLLLWLLSTSGKGAMPIGKAKAVARGVSAATGSTVTVSANGAAVATAAGAGLLAKIAALPIIAKVAAGMVAAALVVGSIGVGLWATQDKADDSATVSVTDSTTEPSAPELCAHEWVDADCTAPKTCKLCDATEGAAPGHAWLDANCKAPETCQSCGQTRGAIGNHLWEAANYQSGEHCSVCQIVEGEPLQPDFERYGLTVLAPQTGVDYKYITGCKDDPTQKTVGTLYLADYRTFESEEGFEAEEGYVWYYARMEIYYDDQNVMQYGFQTSLSFDDYYNVTAWDESTYTNDEGMLCGTVNYNGVDYDQCRVSISGKVLHMSEYACLNYYDFYWRMPVGYDGFVLSFRDSSVAWEDGQHIYDVADENTLMFRFGTETPGNPGATYTETQIKAHLDTSIWGYGTESNAWGKEPGEECTLQLSYTHAIQIRQPYPIVGAEVLSATLNGQPCEVYQSQDRETINNILELEYNGADEEAISSYLAVFLVESPETTAIVGENNTVVAEYYYTIRVYLANQSYVDLTYGSAHYPLSILGGGMISSPEQYA